MQVLVEQVLDFTILIALVAALFCKLPVQPQQPHPTKLPVPQRRELCWPPLGCPPHPTAPEPLPSSGTVPPGLPAFQIWQVYTSVWAMDPYPDYLVLLCCSWFGITSVYAHSLRVWGLG